MAARLDDAADLAACRGIVVEMVLFCPFYKDSMWDLSPLKESNNINGIGKVKRTEVNTLASDVLDLQKRRLELDRERASTSLLSNRRIAANTT